MGMILKHEIYLSNAYVRNAMCSHLFVALSVNAVSVFKPCMTLRGLGDKGCHLIESHLQYLEDEGRSRPTQQYQKCMVLVAWLLLRVLCLW